MSAIISPCGKYRYRLERTVAMSGLTYAFFGINPSTADASVDDATVRKWIGFTKAWGGSRFIVGNVFAYRATNVSELASIENPVGLLNPAHLMSIVADADVLVPCWGSRDKVPRDLHCYIANVEGLLGASNSPVKHFGLTKSGDPKHPLMLGYATPLQDWARA